LVPAHLAMHALPYVLPSFPHTGKYSFVQMQPARTAEAELTQQGVWVDRRTHPAHKASITDTIKYAICWWAGRLSLHIVLIRSDKLRMWVDRQVQPARTPSGSDASKWVDMQFSLLTQQTEILQ
jgi:hypothetical protein